MAMDAKRNKRRGFVLITFKEKEPAEKVLEEKFSTVSGGECEVKVASPQRYIDSSSVALGAAVVAMRVQGPAGRQPPRHYYSPCGH